MLVRVEQRRLLHAAGHARRGTRVTATRPIVLAHCVAETGLAGQVVQAQVEGGRAGPIQLLHRVGIQRPAVDQHLVYPARKGHRVVLVDAPEPALDVAGEIHLCVVDVVRRILGVRGAGASGVEGPGADGIVVGVFGHAAARAAVVLPHRKGAAVGEVQLPVPRIGIEIAVVVRVVVVVHLLVEDFGPVERRAQLGVVASVVVVGYHKVVQRQVSPVLRAADGEAVGGCGGLALEDAGVLRLEHAVHVELDRALVEGEDDVVPGVGGQDAASLPVAHPLSARAEAEAEPVLHVPPSVSHVHSLQRGIGARLPAVQPQDALRLPVQAGGSIPPILDAVAGVLAVRVEPGRDGEAAAAQVQAWVRVDGRVLAAAEPRGLAGHAAHATGTTAARAGDGVAEH